MQLQFYKILLTSSMVVVLMLMLCTGAVTSSKARHRGKSVGLRFPLYQRKLTTQGRSASTSFSYDSPTASTVGQGRGFMKMWKGMFNQPDTNVIIITQPTPTTAPTTSPTTDAPTVRDLSGTTTAIAEGARDDNFVSNTQLGQDDEDLLNTDIFHMTHDNPDDTTVVQQYGSNRNHTPKRKPKPKRHHQQRQRNQRPRNQKRKRAEQIANRIAKKPISSGNIFSMNSNSNSGSSSNNAFDIFAGSLNLNTNARIQSIMNALRQQTPIVYNY